MNKTETRALAEDYLKLGGTRRVMIDDNKTFIRQYDAEPPAAEAFWAGRIAVLDKAHVDDVAFFLPSITTSDPESSTGD